LQVIEAGYHKRPAIRLQKLSSFQKVIRALHYALVPQLGFCFRNFILNDRQFGRVNYDGGGKHCPDEQGKIPKL
jgi:hypothetical protein